MMYPRKIKKSRCGMLNFEIVAEVVNFVFSGIKSLRSPITLVLFFIKSFHF